MWCIGYAHPQSSQVTDAVSEVNPAINDGIVPRNHLRTHLAEPRTIIVAKIGKEEAQDRLKFCLTDCEGDAKDEGSLSMLDAAFFGDLNAKVRSRVR